MRPVMQLKNATAGYFGQLLASPRIRPRTIARQSSPFAGSVQLTRTARETLPRPTLTCFGSILKNRRKCLDSCSIYI